MNDEQRQQRGGNEEALGRDDSAKDAEKDADHFLLRPVDATHPIYRGGSLISTIPPHRSHVDHDEGEADTVEPP